MKKYAAILTLLVFAGVQSSRADLLGISNITSDVSMEVKGQQATNETDLKDSANDHRGATVTRLRVGLNAELAEGVKARIEADRNGGTGGAAGGVAQYGDGASTITGEQGAINFQNAYLDLGEFLHLDSFRIGRQYGGHSGDLLVYYGPVSDDSLTIRALDSLSVTKHWWKLNIQATTGKVMENDAIAGTDAGDGPASAGATGEANVSWLTLSSDELFQVKVPVEFGYYSGTNSNGTTASDNNNLGIYDLRGSYRLMDDKVGIGAEYATNTGGQNGTGPLGSKKSYKGNAILLNANYDDAETGWGGHLKYASASGDDKAGDADDKAFHDFRTIGWASSDYRYGEIMSYDNTVTKILGSADPGGLDTGSEGFGINVINLGGYYQLPWWDKKLMATAEYYIAKANKVPAGANDGIGNEIDLAVNYKHTENIGAALGYATFSPDKGLATLYAPAAVNPPQDTVTKLFAKLWVKWGADRQY